MIEIKLNKNNDNNKKKSSFTVQCKCVRCVPISLMNKRRFGVNACFSSAKTNECTSTFSGFALPSKRFRYQNKTKRVDSIAFILYRAEDVEDQRHTHTMRTPLHTQPYQKYTFGSRFWLQMLLCTVRAYNVCMAWRLDCVWRTRWRRRRRENMLHRCSSFSSVQFNSIEFFVGCARWRHNTNTRTVLCPNRPERRQTHERKNNKPDAWKRKSSDNNNELPHEITVKNTVAEWFPVDEERVTMSAFVHLRWCNTTRT